MSAFEMPPLRAHITTLTTDDDAILAMASGIVARRVRRGEPLLHPKNVAAYCALHAKPTTETMWAFYVTNQLAVIDMKTFTSDEPALICITPRQILRHALMCDAHGLFLAHNHPSGNLAASEHDIAFTRRLGAGTDALGLQLHDHLIVAGDCWTSILTRRRGRITQKETDDGES